MSLDEAQELPLYQSIKKVRAVKISDIEFHPMGQATITPVDSNYGVIETRENWANRYEGTEDDMGYYVVYPDGYSSWSPSEPFEDGYYLIGE